MRNLDPASLRDMVWEWARAESDSARWSQPYHQNLSQRLLTNLAQDTRVGLIESDWKLLEQLVLACRGPLLSGLLDLGTTWYSGDYRVSQLFDVRVIALSQFRAVSPNLTLGEFAGHLERGVGPPGEEALLRGYQSIRASFDPKKVRGMAILVCQVLSGPFVLVEGYTRLSVLASLYQSGELVDDDLRVILGYCPKLSEWHLNNDRRLRRLSPI